MNANLLMPFLAGLMVVAGTDAVRAGCSPSLFTGAICFTAGQACPKGLMAADGRSLETSQYADLFAIIGTIYGSEKEGEFNIPDLSGRAASGANSSSLSVNDHPLGSAFGNASVKLTTRQMPKHTHELDFTTQTVSGTIKAATEQGDSDTPKDNLHAASGELPIYAPLDNPVVMGEPFTLKASSEFGGETDFGGMAPSNQAPVQLREPQLVVTACLVVDGLAMPDSGPPSSGGSGSGGGSGG